MSIKKIIFIYEERNPLGVYVTRYDDVDMDCYDPKERVRKALAYLAKEGGRIECRCLHFCFDDDTSIYCEAKLEDVWHEEGYNRYRTYEKTGIIEVTRRNEYGSTDVPYLIDVATLRRQMYKACESEEVAA